MTNDGVPIGLTCIKCYKCGALYTTDQPPNYGHFNRYYEECPVCGCELNDSFNRISPVKYKFIRWWRGATKWMR